MTKFFTVKTMSQPRELTMRFHQAPHAYDPRMLSGVIVFAFDKQDRILVLKNKKTFDIIHGLTDWEDDTIEDTVRRETHEQARATLGPIALAAVIETTLDDQKSKKPIVTLVATARVKGLEPYSTKAKDKRVFFAKPDFLKHCADYNIEARPQLLEMVEAALDKAEEIAKND